MANTKQEDKTIEDYICAIDKDFEEYKKTHDLRYSMSITRLMGNLTPMLIYSVADIIESKGTRYSLDDIERIRDHMTDIHQYIVANKPVNYATKQKSITGYRFTHPGNKTMH